MMRQMILFYMKRIILMFGVILCNCLFLASVLHVSYTDKFRTMITLRPGGSLSTSSSESLNEILPGEAIDILEWSLDQQQDELSGSDVNVVMVTYMRSGSSFTGDLLQQSPDVFYVFEPLHTLEVLHMVDSKYSADLLSLRRATNYIYREEIFQKLSQDILHDFLSCNFLDLDFKTLKQSHLINSKTTENYFRCIINSNGGVFDILRCLPLIYQSCRKSRVKLVKTIRSKMAVVVNMLENNSKLKIIHLIRDPRGTLMSQARFRRFEYWQLKAFAASFCEQISEDLRISENISLVFPDLIQVVRYEDISKNPVYMTKKMYEFIGLEFTSDINKYINSITSEGREHGGALSTSRANSEVTSRKWRNAIDLKDVITIDSVCADVYRKMGYLPINNLTDLRNVNISLVVKPKVKTLA